MKKFYAILVFVFALALLVGCVEKTPTIQVNSTSVSLEEGEQVTIEVDLSNSSLEVVWLSNNTAIATVSNGTITAVAEGNTTVTATIKDTNVSATIVVTVTKEVVAPTLTLSPTAITLTEEETQTITATLSDPTLEVVWTTSNASVATVTNGVVTALSEGSSTITATIKDTSVSQSVVVTVEAKVDPTITLAEVEPIYINESISLTPVVSDASLTIVWSTSNATVATVTNGVVSALSEGTATITATIQGTEISASVDLTVLTYVLTFEETTATVMEKENYVVLFDLVGKETPLVWTTSSSATATVANGVVSTKRPGTVTITATVQGTSVSASITLTITALPTVSISGDEEILVGTTHQLVGTDTKDLFGVGMLWQSSNTQVATVTNAGLVSALREGTVTITAISLITGESATKELTISFAEATDFSFNVSEEEVETEGSYALQVNLTPFNANPDVIWSSSDETIATIDEYGNLVTTLLPGTVIITGTLASNPEFTMSLTLEIKEKFDPIKFIASLAYTEILAKEIKVTGYQYAYQHDLIGSVHRYFFSPNEIIDSPIPVGSANRPGQIGIPRYVTIHDTGSSAPSADEHAHDRYVRNTTSVSWHYTVGDETAYKHLPHNERAWHAGDGSRAYGENDSGILATSTAYPVVSISADGYWELNGIKSQVLVPMAGDRIARTSDINDDGIRVVVGDNGNWFIGNTYWNGTYRVIANAGGNQGGIGIEMAINEGSDIFASYARLAKLTASIMIKENFNIYDVRQHQFFSGKNCPQTMREAGLWHFFLDMVQAEYDIQTKLHGYAITFTSHNPLYVDNRGRVIQLPTQEMTISYTINVRRGTYNQSITLYATLPAQSQIQR